MSVEVKVEVEGRESGDAALVIEPDGEFLLVRVRAKSGRLPREGVTVAAEDLLHAVATIGAAAGWDPIDGGPER